MRVRVEPVFRAFMSGAWRQDLIPILSLTGLILSGLGALYLAYDLLGGKNGPLRMVTKSVSYGVMFASAYGLPLGVWFGLAGLFGLRSRPEPRNRAFVTLPGLIHLLEPSH